MRSTYKQNEYYWILELQPGATLEQVKEARRILTKVWHPDRFMGDTKMQKKATEKLARINEAYQVLLPILSSSPPHEPSSYSGPPAQRKPTRTQSEQVFITDLLDGETVEIVAIHPEDDYYTARHKFIGKVVTARNPVHNGNGWYCTHVSFASSRKSILFGHVRVTRRTPS